MQDWKTLGDDPLLERIGERLARVRLSKNWTQAYVAEEAGIGLRTLARMEQGEAATRLSYFLRVCRVLGILERFDALLPEERPGPIEQLRMEGKRRRRASGGRTVVEEPPGPWRWRDGA